MEKLTLQPSAAAEDSSTASEMSKLSFPRSNSKGTSNLKIFQYPSFKNLELFPANDGLVLSGFGCFLSADASECSSFLTKLQPLCFCEPLLLPISAYLPLSLVLSSLATVLTIRVCNCLALLGVHSL